MGFWVWGLGFWRSGPKPVGPEAAIASEKCANLSHAQLCQEVEHHHMEMIEMRDRLQKGLKRTLHLEVKMQWWARSASPERQDDCPPSQHYKLERGVEEMEDAWNCQPCCHSPGLLFKQRGGRAPLLNAAQLGRAAKPQRSRL